VRPRNELRVRMRCGRLELRPDTMAVTPTSQPAGTDPLASPQSVCCTFGLFELELSTGELRRAGRPIHLAPQPARVLVALAERAGHIVTREELKESVWGHDTFVDFEQGLTFCVKQIRSALGDDAENPRFIETVPRRGYRLMGPVQRIVTPALAVVPEPPSSADFAPTPRRSWGTTALLLIAAALLVGAVAWYFGWARARGLSDAPAKTMIAVLPFENLGGDPEQDYFSSGFAGELIAQLGQVDPDRLGVIARTSTLAYRGTTKSAGQIGGELGVQHLVEGTVRRSGDRVRINAQLIRVADQSHVWAEIFEGDVHDILGLQREVGRAIAQHVVGTLSPARSNPPRAVDPAVYDVYLRARAMWNRRKTEDRHMAIATFEEAIRRDPTFAPAYAGLADGLLVEKPAAGLAAAEKALTLDDRLAEAHSARAHALMHMLQWTPAEEAFRRAIALDPSYVPARYFYAEYLVARGRRAQAIEHARQGVALDPMSAIATHAAGVILYYCADYEEALRHLRRALELDPEHYWSHARIALVLERERAYDAAIAEFDLAHQRVRSVYSRAAAGRAAEARLMINETLGDPGVDLQAFHLAGAYVGIGDHAAALKWLATAVERQVYDVVYMYVDPRLESIRSRPEFQELLRRGGWQ